MAEIATIARPYAEALFKAAASNLDGATAWVNALAQVAGNAQLQAFAQDPKTNAVQLSELLLSVAKVNDTQAQNFLATVIDNGRVSALPEIANQFKALVNASKGVSDAIVYSAFPLDGAALAQLHGLLEKRFAKKLSVSVQLDATLIGGVRVVVGDEVLDTSVRARLDQMKVALTA